MKVIHIFITILLLTTGLFQTNISAHGRRRSPMLPEGAKVRLGGAHKTDYAFSPDATRIAVAHAYIGIWLYDANDGTELTLLTGHTEPITSVAFSPDGKTLVSGSHDLTIRLWDMSTFEHKMTLLGHTGIPTVFAFSPGGNTFASGAQHSSGTFGNKEDLLPKAGESIDSAIRLWDIKTGKLKTTLTGQIGWITALAFSSDGAMLACRSTAGNISIWNIATGQHRMLKSSPDDQWRAIGVNSLAFSPDSKMFASGGSKDKLVCLWEAQTGENIETFIGHTEGVNSVAFSPDGKTLASGSYDETIRLWNLETREHETTLTGNSYSANVITFSPDGNTLMSGYRDGTYRAWDPETGELKNTFIHSPNMTYPAISPDGKLLAVGYDKVIQLWETDTGKLKTTLIGHTHPVYSLKFSYDGSTIRSKDRRHIWVWDVEKEKHKQILPNPPNTISDIKINGRTRVLSPERDILAVGNSDGTIELCNTSTGEQRALFNEHTDRISVIVFSPDGTTLASAADDDTIQLWDLVNMKHIGSLVDMVNGSTVLAFSEDCPLLTGGGSWGDVDLWK